MIDCLELMLEAGTIHLLYKLNDNEYEKYQQFACILKIESRDQGKDYIFYRLNEKYMPPVPQEKYIESEETIPLGGFLDDLNRE